MYPLTPLLTNLLNLNDTYPLFTGNKFFAPHLGIFTHTEILERNNKKRPHASGTPLIACLINMSITYYVLT